MRTVFRSGVALAVLASAVLAGTDRVDPAAAIRAQVPTVVSIGPTPSATVGVAHPVIVTFEAPVRDRDLAERIADVATSPARTGFFEWVNDTVAQWIPDDYWPAHSTVLLSVAGRKAQFRTGPEVIGVADISEHTFTVTIDGAATGLGLPAPHHLPRAGEPGVLLASMGRPEYATPPGKYSVLAKEKDVVMDSSSVGIPKDHPDGYLLDVEHAVRFTHRGLFVHSAPWAVGSIGFDNVSHGCISLIPAAAEWYYDTVNIGDPIIVVE